jgi:hypothetical protein
MDVDRLDVAEGERPAQRIDQDAARSRFSVAEAAKVRWSENSLSALPVVVPGENWISVDGLNAKDTEPRSLTPA